MAVVSTVSYTIPVVKVLAVERSRPHLRLQSKTVIFGIFFCIDIRAKDRKDRKARKEHRKKLKALQHEERGKKT